MYQMNTFITCTELYDEYVLIDTRTGEYYELNEIGNLFFRELISAKDERSAVSSLLDKIESTAEMITNEFRTFAEKLIQDGMVTTKSDNNEK